MTGLSSLFGSAEAPELQCSRKGCTARADQRLLWNNPAIHTPDRRKVWLACPEHAAWLEQYLDERGLFRSKEPITP